ncbi:glycosyltransferase [Alicyclobacillus sp. TC]|uniref:UDP-D-galactose:(Glucosyl)LPS alpha-1,6-D-galactosyltransferase n=1 Tax=Alicyclobacillus tolerans TaxID=90970 RepID=A0A1M6M4B4_9BACL|nr:MULTISPECIES: glycosyltransferase [Alicyclobacillus]QRF22641.1 glycosyltransferase [Alicyclobacillus sp. TC]SHJ78328.1 UDP-D-galactose:(glucosyl)LPS alpha-1,6-D-galactosyltransferase [Alicyclobacillus montanus]
MKIFFVLEHLSGRGGVESVLQTITKELEKIGHNIFIFLPDQSDQPTWEVNHNIIYYDERANSSINGIHFVTKRILGLSSLAYQLPKPDLVVGTHVPHTVLYSKMAFGHYDIPIVSWLHNPPNLFNDSHFVNYADIHWCISQGIKSILQNTIPISKIYWVGNPIEQNIPPVSIHQGSSRFIYIGRLENQQKRLDILFSALHYLKSDWLLDIYGDGPDRDKLFQLAKKLGIASKIRWNGWVDRPWESIQSASALLLTSDFEGLPMVIGESLSRGLPVISSKCPTGPEDLIQHGQNGLLFERGNVQELTAQLITFQNLTPNERLAMSENAILSVKKYNKHHVIERMLNSICPNNQEGDTI